jgi:polar amino acid transport system substrate-binding protein
MKMSYLAIVLLAAAALMVESLSPTLADDSTRLNDLRKQGFARIAIANEPPFTQVDADGKVSGAGPDVARAVFKRLGVADVVASLSEYGAMIPGLQAGRFDAVTAGYYMRPERCAAALYSEPTLCDGESFIVKKGNPLKLTGYKSVAGDGSALIGVFPTSVEEKLALSAGVPADRIVPIPDAQSGLKMLQDGRISALATTSLSIAHLLLVAKDDSLESVTPVEGTGISCDGAIFSKRDRALRDAYDKALAELKASGEFAKIIEPYGFSAKLAMSTTRDKLCGGPN